MTAGDGSAAGRAVPEEPAGGRHRDDEDGRAVDGGEPRLVADGGTDNVEPGGVSRLRSG
jgi:hypothetical protein